MATVRKLIHLKYETEKFAPKDEYPKNTKTMPNILDIPPPQMKVKRIAKTVDKLLQRPIVMEVYIFSLIYIYIYIYMEFPA